MEFYSIKEKLPALNTAILGYNPEGDAVEGTGIKTYFSVVVIKSLEISKQVYSSVQNNFSSIESDAFEYAYFADDTSNNYICEGYEHLVDLKISDLSPEHLELAFCEQRNDGVVYHVPAMDELIEFYKWPFYESLLAEGSNFHFITHWANLPENKETTE